MDLRDTSNHSAEATPWMSLKKTQILNVKKNNIILEENKYWTLSKINEIKLSTTKIWVWQAIQEFVSLFSLFRNAENSSREVFYTLGGLCTQR